MKIYNTLSRRYEEFVPVQPGRAGLYTCGPTVYDYAHVGNFRAYVFEDILRRYLKFQGLQVTQVMNITDIDDKTIRGSCAKGVSLADYTGIYVRAFFEDLKTLSIEPAEFYPAATGHIAEMVDLIRRLMEAGLAYVSEDGSVYFSVNKFPGYGRLAHLDLSGMRTGVRVALDEYDKENVADFALWKAWDESDGDVAWDSPWGRGRPGWHIECSAMSMKYLGPGFDLHTGGVDNMFPHHENEIAQSEGATGQPFVKYWMHCAHLQVDGQKMSKSLGNFFTLRDLLEKGFSGREIRYVLLSAHYRQTLNFTLPGLSAARSALARLDEFYHRLRERAGGSAGVQPAADLSEDFRVDWQKEGLTRFRAAMDDDLNTPEALGALFDMIHAGNRALDTGSVGVEEAAQGIRVLQGMDRVFAVLPVLEESADEEALDLVEKRKEARAAKDWKESDRIRDELARLGWEVRDTPEGAKLKKLS